MDVRQGSSIPQASQVPITPMKADFATSRPICGNMQENQQAHGNWPELQRISQEQHLGRVNQLELRNFLQGTEAQNTAAYRDLTNSVSVSEYYDAWEAAVATKSKMCAESINMYNFSTENIGQLSTVSFGNLLALAHAAGSTAIAQNTNAETASTMNRPFNSLASTPDADGSSFCSRFPFNLNSPTRMTDAVFSSNNGLQFEPITPDQIKNKEKASDLSDLDINKAPIEGHMLSNEDTIKRAEADDRQENKEQSGVVLNQSESENHKPDKLGEHDAELNNTPQKKPRRKKHRPKVVIEGQPKRTPRPKNPQQHGSEENKKRKYVRRNMVEQPPGTPSDEINYMTGHERQPPTSRETSKARRKYVRRNQADNVVPSDAKEGTNGTIDPPKVSRPKRTCRRSLNFDIESQLSDQNSSFWESSTVEDVHANQAQSTSQHQMQDPDPSTRKKIGLNHGKSTMDKNEISRGKCKIIFLDETHDKQACQASILEMTPRSPNSSNCSSTACLSQQTQEQALKSQQPCGTDEAKLNCTNDRGAHVNSVQAYQAILPANEPNIHSTQGMHFPAIYKKKRTEKGHSSATSYTQPLTCETNYVSLPRCNVGLYPTGTSANDEGNNRMQNSKFIPSFVEAEMLRKKRSKAVTKGRDFASLDEICKHFSTSQATTSGCGERYETSHQPTTCIEALVSDTRATMKTKKRSKRSILASSMASDMYVRQHFATNARGLLPAITWSGMSPVDEIAERLQHLDLNRERRQDQYRLITYQNKFQAENALVLYQRDGSIVPFGGSFVKKRKPRPRVDLDDETNRVWKLLLQDINSEGIDGTDEDKAKWWEEERGVFSNRADSFVAQMRLVQGDRRFSPWKGSVVDSVVGVFLTQNVSDHLSSSAFMSLAARFPLMSKSSTEKHEQRREIIIEEPEVSGVDPDDTIRWHGDKSDQPTLDQDSLKISSTDSSEETAAINSSESSENSTNCIMSTENFIAQRPDSSSREGSDVYRESTVYRLARSQIAATSFLGNQIQLEPDNLHSFQDSVVSSQNSVGFSGVQASERTESSNFCVLPTGCSSFSPQLDVDCQLQHGTHCSQVKKDEEENHKSSLEDVSPCSYSGSCPMPNLGAEGTRCNEELQEDGKFPDICRKLGAPEQVELLAESADQAMNGKMTRMEINSCNDHLNKVDTAIIEDLEVNVEKKNQIEEDNSNVLRVPEAPTFSETIVDDRERVSIVVDSCKSEHKAVELHTNNENNHVGSTLDRANDNTSKAKKGRTGKEKEHVDWDSLRLQAQTNGNIRERTVNTMDSLDYEAVRCADVNEIAHTIRERGMNNMLAERIKDFLNRIVREHGSIDLEWLRDVPPDKAKEYLLSIRGLGLKSVECVRLLTLHHLAFPVDTNVGRIAVRLGWVPLQPLPESLQLHLLELYPILESIQKYLWPRLCKLDQETLYELHYHMITFGKVFCTKSKPNCNACPLRGECRHFASAFASARLGLPAPEEKSIVTATENKAADQNQFHNVSQLPLLLPQADQTPVEPHNLINSAPIIEVPATPEPIIEVPTTPESESIAPEIDIEDAFSEDPNEIPMIKLNMVEFTQNVKNFVENNMELHQVEMSKALVALTPEAASIPTPKLKNISRLRTEHQVYELPDSHPLLKGLDKREPDDPCSYLLAIWTPGETADSIDPPERQCNSQESGGLCDDETCFACNSIREAHTQTVRGTLLIPCRTAMRGSFPLNGTYFQVNEVFADHDSSLSPIDVPRHWLWNLPRRTVYFGTSIPTIFKGQNTESIQHCFWRGFVCVRGFDQKTRAPRPLMARLHFPASKLTKTKGKPEEN